MWASDFTFISYRGAFVYLCTVIDVFTGEVLGFNISRTHDADFVLLAIKRAIARAGGVPEWFHSDQGSEYASSLVRSFLKSQGVKVSMNPKSSPWCNGSQESFFGRFKVEFGDFQRFDTYAELLEELYQQLHYFTFERIKTKLKMPPAEFRVQWIERGLRFSERPVEFEPPQCPQWRGRDSTLAMGTPEKLARSAILRRSAIDPLYARSPLPTLC